MRSLRGLRGRGVTVLVLLFCFVALAVPALAQSLEDRLDTNEEKRQKAAAKADMYDALADKLARKVAVVDEAAARIQSEVNGLTGEMDKLNDNIARVERDLTATQQRLNAVTRELQRILRKLDNRTDLFTDRAVAAYMAGPTGQLEGLLSSTTFNEVVDRTSYYEAALDADSKLVSNIEVLRDKTEIVRVQVEAEEEKFAIQKLALEEDKADLAQVLQERDSALQAQQAKLAEKESLLANAETKESRYRQVVAQLDADDDRIQALLAARAAAASTGGSIGALPTGGGQLLWPASGPMTSPYGYRTHPIFGDSRLHTGIDIGAPYGAPVIAADAGVVAFAGTMGGYGNVVVVDHGGGLATTYNHLATFSVSSGQSVGRGAPIANVGSSGYSTGPHLHFEVRVNGSPVDPMPYLQ